MEQKHDPEELVDVAELERRAIGRAAAVSFELAALAFAEFAHGCREEGERILRNAKKITDAICGLERRPTID